ncbi:SDR family oxidoreductase [Neptuniibacter sp. QD29_5]|uniref:SDR family oxidoreductase n=1 Tax=Neptuniibacter sp. QD29_5 TaxID=3398207 RepID=UPI0039F4F35F
MATLTNKKALVLGGSRGIGAAVVARLQQEGAATSFTYANSDHAATEVAANTGAKPIKVDSSNREALAAVIQDQGALDILIIAAGVLIMGNPLTQSPEAIDHMLDVNVRSPYHASIEAAKSMNQSGRIIVIGSVNADRMPMAGGTAYALTKSAMQGLVRGLARDLGDRNITVNNIQPGPVDTEMNPKDGPMKETMHSFMAIKRHAQASEIAGMVAYLTSDEASFITGAQHTIDGGFGA